MTKSGFRWHSPKFMDAKPDEGWDGVWLPVKAMSMPWGRSPGRGPPGMVMRHPAPGWAEAPGFAAGPADTRKGVAAPDLFLGSRREHGMNYFASLLLTAGLLGAPHWGIQPAAVRVTATTVHVSSWTTPSVATVSQSYQVLMDRAAGAAPAAAPSPPSPSAPTGNAGGTAAGTTAPSGTTAAQTLIQLINQARSQHGLAPYTVNTTLMSLAEIRAQALATDGVFTSDLPHLGWPIQMEQAAGISAQGMGAENIAEASSVTAAFQLLMASPPHRSNVLNPHETQVGVGVAPLSNGVAVSELFIGPNS